MNARRCAALTALIAATLGLGLLLNRPQASPALRPGKRGPRTEARRGHATAAPIAARSRTPGTRSAGATADGPSADEFAAWQDALNARGFFEGGLAWSAPGPGAAPTAPGSRSAREPIRHDPARTRRANASEDVSQKPPRVTRNLRPRPSSGRPPPARPHPRRFGVDFTGPATHEAAPARQDEHDDPRVVSAVRGRSASSLRRPQTQFPLFHPPPDSTRTSAQVGRRRAQRPPLLSRLLGRGARRPPNSALSPPDLSSLDARRPAAMPDGGPVPTRPFALQMLEALDPARAGTAACRRRQPHWHRDHLRHDGAARGLAQGDQWLWLWREKGLWWAKPDQQSPPLLRHQGLWWHKQNRIWFAVHEGELWSWRRFSQWDAEGLMRLRDGAEIVYSADFARVAVITPGAGAVLYDAATGFELGRWAEHELPRRRPRAPTELRLPRGI